MYNYFFCRLRSNNINNISLKKQKMFYPEILFQVIVYER